METPEHFAALFPEDQLRIIALEAEDCLSREAIESLGAAATLLEQFRWLVAYGPPGERVQRQDEAKD